MIVIASVFTVLIFIASISLRYLRTLTRGKAVTIQLSMLLWHWRQSVEYPSA
jgi:hypothetical protein